MVVDESEFHRPGFGYSMHRCTVHTREQVRTKALGIPTSANFNVSQLTQKTSFQLSFGRALGVIPCNWVLFFLCNGPRPESFTEGDAN